MKFRKDINGLRAIAVIAVVFFHYNNLQSLSADILLNLCL